MAYWPLFCVISPHSVASTAQCIKVVEDIVKKVHVCYHISWWVSCIKSK